MERDDNQQEVKSDVIDTGTPWKGKSRGFLAHLVNRFSPSLFFLSSFCSWRKARCFERRKKQYITHIFSLIVLYKNRIHGAHTAQCTDILKRRTMTAAKEQEEEEMEEEMEGRNSKGDHAGLWISKWNDTCGTSRCYRVIFVVFRLHESHRSMADVSKYMSF